MTLPDRKTSIRNLYPEIRIDGDFAVDFWRAWRLTTEFKDKVKDFDTILLSEGDRWDTIAEAAYNDRELWWVVALFNDVEDPFKIYVDKTISNSLKKIKVIKREYVDIILDDIRRNRVVFEKKDREEVN